MNREQKIYLALCCMAGLIIGLISNDFYDLLRTFFIYFMGYGVRHFYQEDN